MYEKTLAPLDSQWETFGTTKDADSYEDAKPDDESEALIYPTVPFSETSKEYFPFDETWFLYSSWDWLYSPENKMYFNVSSNKFFTFNTYTNAYEEVNEADLDEYFVSIKSYLIKALYEYYQQSTLESPEYEEEPQVVSTAPTEDALDQATNVYAVDEDHSYFFIDFDKDIYFYTAQLMSTISGKTEREDRHVSKERIELGSLCESEACCLYTGIFDGHGGAICAEYCVKHLKSNLIQAFQDAKKIINKKLTKYMAAENKEEATTYDLGLLHSSDVEALKRGLIKAFELTDGAYLTFAQKKGLNDGCTALTVLLYGPDEDGSLKLLTAHVGDCRAVVCRDRTAIRLTEDHKPNQKNEKKRIIAMGGKVVHVRGVWRVMATVGNKVFGLSTARSIGDFHMKQPKMLVPSIPDLRVHTVDFYRDLFVILGSDGIWDVLSDQEACDIVTKHIENDCVESAADALVNIAADRGSTDDKTATVVYFGWKHNLYPENPNE